MRLALAQFEIEAGNVEANVRRAADRIDEAVSRGADLVVLPELWNVGFFAFESYARVAESIEGPTLSRMADLAAEHGVGILAGSIVEDLAESPVETPEDVGLANTTVMFDREGNRIAHYRKRHLFGYKSEEASRLTAGEDLGVADFEGFRIGMTTCYDLRFPELYRELLDKGVTMVLVPSAWPYPRVEHWDVLARARAIENLLYVGAANGIGTFGDDALVGRSQILDPWGTTLAAASDEEAIVMADVDVDRVKTVRNEFPSVRDRRQ